MKIIVVGGTGLIGAAVVKELSPRHEVIVVGHKGGDVQCDISSEDSILAMYQTIGNFDALVSTTGRVVFAELTRLTSEKYMVGIENKLLGQVNLVMHGFDYINDGGSFTLTTGILNRDPIATGASAAMINGAIEGFVVGASIEMPRRVRLNCVSPTVIEEALPKYESFFRGFEAVPAAKAALAYSKSVEGLQTGKIYTVE